MIEIKRIKKISLANIAALLYALFGFVATLGILIYSLVLAAHDKQLDSKMAIYLLTNLGLDFLIALAAAIIAGAIGWILGLVVAGFYNFVVKTTGGIKIELIDEAGAAMTMRPEEKKQELFKY